MKGIQANCRVRVIFDPGAKFYIHVDCLELVEEVEVQP